jgi:uncharacterized damage-inducible protein DinB
MTPQVSPVSNLGEIMSNVASLRDLYRHMEWADSVVWAAVRATPAAETDPRLKILLQHLHMVQQAFLGVWTERPAGLRTADDFACLGDVEAWARPYYAEAHAFLAQQEDEALAAAQPLPWAALLVSHLGRVPCQTTRGETMLQVASHSTYHRGQINVRIRELGGEPPLVDYIAWLWLGRPAAVWPEPV